MIDVEIGVGCGHQTQGCAEQGDCPSPPDLCIKRNDTKPSFKASISDCDGPIDFSSETNLVVEASMWFDSKLKQSLDSESLSLSFADNIGFDSVMVGDIIVTHKSRSPEFMLVSFVDEGSKSVQVVRGQEDTNVVDWPKGTPLSIFRFRDLSGNLEQIYDTSESVDGTAQTLLSETILGFDWEPHHTAAPGCYWIEFKIMKVADSSPNEVEWIKRVPLSSPGFVVRVLDSST